MESTGSIVSAAPFDLGLHGLDRGAVEATENVIYVVDPEWNVLFCNPGWDRFALENGGENAVRAKVVGMNLRRVIPAPLLPFYEDVFRISRDRSELVTFDYDCSSSELYRLYRMQVKFLPSCPSFVIVNSLRLEQKHLLRGTVSHSPDEFQYTSEQGFVTMCCNCRRTRRTRALETWDWVPAFVKSPPQKTSHGICPICVTHLYADSIRKASVIGSAGQ